MTVPFVYSHTTDHRGAVVLRGHSLLDLVDLRDRYAKWYSANGVRAGEPVGIVVAEGLEPLLHYLALNAIGAFPALINDAMRPDVMFRYLNHVGVVGVVADDTTRLASAYRADPARRPRFLALAAEVQAFDADSAPLPRPYPYRHRPDDVCALIHSSGTTGTPKSTILGHLSFWDGKQPRMVRFPAEPYDRLMSLMPHTHAGGLSYFLTATLLGLPTVVMADWRRAVVEPVMEAFQPTMVASFPRTFVELATGDLPRKGAAKVHSWFNTGRLRALRPHPATGPARRAPGRSHQVVVAAEGSGRREGAAGFAVRRRPRLLRDGHGAVRRAHHAGDAAQ